MRGNVSARACFVLVWFPDLSTQAHARASPRACAYTWKGLGTRLVSPMYAISV